MQARLGKLMAEAAEGQDYELAAVYRDRLRALTYIQGSQTVHAEGLGDADIFALACQAGQMCIQAFFIRGGQNWGHRSFFPAHTNDVPEDEVLTAFLVQFYEDMPPPKRILIDRDLTEVELLTEALGERAERKIAIERPQRGDRKKLVDQAKRNAEEALERRLAEGTTQGKLLRELTDTFELPDLPKRIEVYDNSHIMGTNATGAMIVAGPEGFRKNAYRKFNIKSGITPGDDFGMMKEVLERRFARLEKEDPDRSSGEWPDLILIDGGKGQVSAVCEIMESAGVQDVPVIGIAKGPHHGREGREVFHFPDGREISLPPNAPLMFYLQRLRDEAHRFAIGTHRAKRAKSLTTSTLDEVPGIGPNRKRALLMHFGTARAVKGAALEDLETCARHQQGDRSAALRLFPSARLMRVSLSAIVLGMRKHGEQGAVVRLLTADRGLQAAYVRGARGRRMRPVLIAGNLVEARLSARTEAQLAQAELELIHSRAPLLGEPLPAAAIDWATTLDGNGASRTAALSAAICRARWPAGGDRGSTIRKWMGRRNGPLRTPASGRNGLWARSRPVRGKRDTRRACRREPEVRQSGIGGGSHALRRETLAATAIHKDRRGSLAS